MQKLSNSNIFGTCNIAVIKLKWSKSLDVNVSRAQQLRGAIASNFPDESIFHNHNKADYKYPLIQYRWDLETGDGIVAGINQGAERILKVPWLDLPLTLGEEQLTIEETDISYKKGVFAFSDRLERYNFISPWVAFHRENYKTYQTLSPEEQIEERDRLLVAHILGALRQININVPDTLYAAFNLHHQMIAPYKEQGFTGFFGEFLTNLVLPDNFSFGRSVSHGYGWFSKNTQVSISKR